MTLKYVAIVALIFWVGRNLAEVTSQFQWPYLGARWVGSCIGGTVADPIVWMLVVGIVVLNYREKKAAKKD